MTAPVLLDHILVGVMTAIMLFAIFRGQPAAKKFTFDTATRLSVYWSNGIILWVVAGAAVTVWIVAGRPLAEMGLAWGTMPVAAIVLVAAFVAWYAVECWLALGSETRRDKSIARFHRDAPFMPTTPRELVHFSFLALSAGVCEEILFRGYLIPYAGWFTGSSVLGTCVAVLIPAVAFGAAHWYQEWKFVARIVGLAAAFGAVFLLTRSLLIPIVLHVVIDLIGGLITLRLMRTPAAQVPISGT